MVSRGNLLVSARSRIPASRVEALIQHEVGTHVLTYHNGRAQKLRHLYTGLAGYDACRKGSPSWPSTWSAGSAGRGCACWRLASWPPAG